MVTLEPLLILPAEGELTIEGVVSDVGPTVIRVEMDNPTNSLRVLDIAKRAKKTWRMDKGFSTITFDRMQKALGEMEMGMNPVLDYIAASHSSPGTQLPPFSAHGQPTWA